MEKQRRRSLELSPSRFSNLKLVTEKFSESFSLGLGDLSQNFGTRTGTDENCQRELFITISVCVTQRKVYKERYMRERYILYTV